MKPIPVTILTGFLGAGKTTFLNEWLGQFPNQKWAIIENEWGKVNIDQSFIQGENQPIFPLTQGCICCTLNEEFYQVLHEIHQHSDSWDGLLIETTGVADPAGVLSPFLITPALKEAFPLARIICIVDPALWKQRVEESLEIRKQAAYASQFVLTKTDQVAPSLVEEVVHELQTHFPDTPIFQRQKGSYPWEVLVKPTFYQGPENLDQWPNKDHHTTFFSSLSFRLEQPVDLNTFRWRLAGFLTFQAQDVWRMKGWVIDQQGQPWRVQTVGNQVQIEKMDQQVPPFSVLVLIGKNLQRPGYEKFLKSCLLR